MLDHSGVISTVGRKLPVKQFASKLRSRTEADTAGRPALRAPQVLSCAERCIELNAAVLSAGVVEVGNMACATPASRTRFIWSFRHHSPGKDSRFPSKLPKSGGGYL